jgi:uncharacterized SAM-binding protein YcdF (DUF218 family)
MLYLLKIVYATFLLPPGCFLVCFAGLGWWLWRKKERPAAGLLLLLTFLLYAASTPALSEALVRSLEERYEPTTQMAQGDVLVVLGGGATLDTPNVQGEGHLSGHAANRLLTAYQLYRLEPRPIIFSGGEVFAGNGCEAAVAKHILQSLGVPERDILVEGQSRNTTENALFVRQILQEQGFSQPVLVTSAFHMDRSVKQFAKIGVLTHPYPAGYMVNRHAIFEPRKLVPSADSLADTSLALKEHIALLAVRWY